MPGSLTTTRLTHRQAGAAHFLPLPRPPAPPPNPEPPRAENPPIPPEKLRPRLGDAPRIPAEGVERMLGERNDDEGAERMLRELNDGEGVERMLRELNDGEGAERILRELNDGEGVERILREFNDGEGDWMDEREEDLGCKERFGEPLPNPGDRAARPIVEGADGKVRPALRSILRSVLPVAGDVPRICPAALKPRELNPLDIGPAEAELFIRRPGEFSLRTLGPRALCPVGSIPEKRGCPDVPDLIVGPPLTVAPLSPRDDLDRLDGSIRTALSMRLGPPIRLAVSTRIGLLRTTESSVRTSLPPGTLLPGTLPPF